MRKLIIYILTAIIPLVAQAQTLDEYLVMAGENNPGIKAKYLAYQAALEKVPQVGSLPDPQLSFGYFVLPPETRVGAQQAQFSISQMFPWFGSLKANKDAATLEAKAKFEAFEAGKNQLYFQIKQVYFQLWELQSDIGLMGKNLEILKSYESLATTKYENGKAGLVDVIRVQMQMDEKQNDLDIMKQREAPLKAKFNSLLNREPEAEIFIPKKLATAGGFIAETADSMVTDNPLLTQLDWEAKSYEQQIASAKKAGMPKIGVGLNYTIVQERTDMDVPDNGKDIFMPMVSVSLPIYRGKYTAMKKEAELKMQAVQQHKTQLQNSLTVDYTEADWNYKDAMSRIELYNELITKSGSALNILITAYSSDNKDFEEVLRMQQQILKYQMQLVKAEAELNIALAKLNLITGQ